MIDSHVKWMTVTVGLVAMIVALVIVVTLFTSLAAPDTGPTEEQPYVLTDLRTGKQTAFHCPPQNLYVVGDLDVQRRTWSQYWLLVVDDVTAYAIALPDAIPEYYNQDCR